MMRLIKVAVIMTVVVWALIQMAGSLPSKDEMQYRRAHNVPDNVAVPEWRYKR